MSWDMPLLQQGKPYVNPMFLFFPPYGLVDGFYLTNLKFLFLDYIK